jgi:serine/threonine protein kinase
LVSSHAAALAIFCLLAGDSRDTVALFALSGIVTDVMETSVDDLCSLLVRSRLLTEEDVGKMRERWHGEAAEDAGKVRRFRKWVVAKGYATDYQVDCVLAGHTEHFFLDDYKLLERIGKGRMAGVFKAQHRLGQIVAIKVLPPSKAKDPEIFGRFLREARLAARLKHPNVVRTFQISEAIGVHYLVMEYLEGETLEEILKRRGRLPVSEATRIVYQALAGLQHIHEQGLVHRDVKPANLVLVPASEQGRRDTTENATVKILDIGLGRALFDENVPGSPNNFQLTAEGASLGEPEYLAPEQARDAHSVDIRADIYSLGCVFYRALAGQTPFADTSPVRQLVRHATEPPRPLGELNPKVPDGISQIVTTMLAKDPAQRYPTPERAAMALRPFLAAGTEPLVAKHVAPEMESYLTWLDNEPKQLKEKIKAAQMEGHGSWRSLFVELLPPEVEESAAPSGSKPVARGKGRTFAGNLPAAKTEAPAKQAPPPRRVNQPKPVAKPARIATAKESPAVVVPKKAAANHPPTKQEIREIDVELVPAEPEKPEAKPGWEGRHLLLLGIGIGALGGVLLVGIASWLLVHFLGK